MRAHDRFFKVRAIFSLCMQKRWKRAHGTLCRNREYILRISSFLCPSLLMSLLHILTTPLLTTRTPTHGDMETYKGRNKRSAAEKEAQLSHPMLRLRYQIDREDTVQQLQREDEERESKRRKYDDAVANMKKKMPVPPPALPASTPVPSAPSTAHILAHRLSLQASRQQLQQELPLTMWVECRKQEEALQVWRKHGDEGEGEKRMAVFAYEFPATSSKSGARKYIVASYHGA